MLHWETVSDQLKDYLNRLMQSEVFSQYRLVGGTALSLHLGHRLSIDIDLFTDASYSSIDYKAIETFLKQTFSYVHGDFGLLPGMGKSYFLGENEDRAIKLDVYYSNDPFFQKAVEIENIRIATVEEIIAMKVDIIQRTGRKKDFWDLHETLSHYDVLKMIDLHRQRSEYNHHPNLILDNFSNFKKADTEPDPDCLRSKDWAFIKEDIVEARNHARAALS